MKSFKETIYFHRSKDDNYEIVEEAKSLGYNQTHDLLNLGYEVEMEVEIFENGKLKVLKIAGKDVSDKGISI